MSYIERSCYEALERAYLETLDIDELITDDDFYLTLDDMECETLREDFVVQGLQVGQPRVASSKCTDRLRTLRSPDYGSEGRRQMHA